MRPAALLNINVMHARYYQNNVLNYFFFLLMWCPGQLARISINSTDLEVNDYVNL
jgi:hypothetical protein